MNRRAITQLLAIIVAILAIGFSSGPLVTNSPKADVNTVFDESYPEVIEVVDGDTIKVSDGSSEKTVRLIGIDTPETKDPRKPVQYYGKEASAFTKDLLELRHVNLQKDISDTDRYGRLLRYVYLGDGTLVNEKLLREGYARVSTFPPDVKFADLFVEAERDAREHRRGLWQ